MRDLISRKQVIKIIDELGYVNCYDQKDYKANSRVDKVRQKIVEMPIAYDVDKVCKKINENKDIDNLIDTDHAIKIVKSGGTVLRMNRLEGWKKDCKVIKKGGVHFE